MPLEASSVHDKATATVEVLDKMTPKQKEEKPTAAFAEDLNRLLEMAKEVAPNLDPRVWPQPYEVQEAAISRLLFVTTNYSEMEVFARQIQKFVKSVMPMPEAGDIPSYKGFDLRGGGSRR